MRAAALALALLVAACAAPGSPGDPVFDAGKCQGATVRLEKTTAALDAMSPFFTDPKWAERVALARLALMMATAGVAAVCPAPALPATPP